MRFITVYLLSAAISALGALAHADDRAQFAEGGNASRAVFHDARTPQVIVRHPQPHWTSSIGTGAAAILERQRNTDSSAHVDPPVALAQYPEANWTSRIGTGTAGMSER
jgi:hypothetical protein